jgi:riboflavin synthase
MFTGIVEELGAVAGLVDLGDAARITVRGTVVTADTGGLSNADRGGPAGPAGPAGIAAGDSIAVNGVCLTVVDVVDGAFTADVMRETLDRSALGRLAVGDPVNLERAATLTTRLGGHLVQGHVDGVGEIRSRQPAEQWEVVTVSLPRALARYVVEKGSVAVDGVSLTVARIGTDDFDVSLIPTTLKLTTLGSKGVGEPVNLEVDVIAKYVEKLVGDRS